MIPGAQYAFQVIHPGSPMLRIRYRNGVGVDPWGFPDWTPYARAVAELPPASPDLGVDEARVLDVLRASEALGTPTPAGWTWAHLGRTRRIALVPVELHGAFRHLGGVSTGGADRRRRGLPGTSGGPPSILVTERLSSDAVAKVEEHLGYALPPAYRDFLARTNGGRPATPAVHPGFGFLVDQPFFGLSRQDWMQDLVYANAWFGDRLTADFLAVGYVQGGLIAVRVRGGDEGSVWYWDDDDPRDRDELTAEEICARLLHRVADDFTAFWTALRDVPEALRALAAAGPARLLDDPRIGTALPTRRRAA
ncbi:MAG: HNH endonuclease [Micromonosporaceae bacterium]|jgi:hypothetical protein|nr:HNH endonuclease [Micromonosporaceae bacterium]